MRVAVVPDKPEYDEVEPPILEEFKAVDAGSAFREIADQLIKVYRRAL